MSFLQTIEAKLEYLVQRLIDDEHPDAVKAKEILDDVKAEAVTAAKTVETDAEPVIAEAEKVAESTATQAVETVATDVVKDVAA